MTSGVKPEVGHLIDQRRRARRLAACILGREDHFGGFFAHLLQNLVQDLLHGARRRRNCPLTRFFALKTLSKAVSTSVHSAVLS